MFKKALTLLVVLVMAGFAFGKGGPVYNAEDVSTGYTNPYLHPWSTDQVTWSITASLPQYQYRAANGAIGNYFYVFGEQNNPYANAYNITTDSWVSSTPPPLGNCNWCGVATDNAFYIVGRYSGAYGNEVQKFVPSGGGPTGTWSQVASYPMAMCGIAAAWDGGDLIYAAGGGGSSGAVANAYKYSISGNTWTAIASMPTPMKYCGGWFAAGKFVIYGDINLPNQCNVYDPGTDTWSIGASVPVGVNFSTFSTTGTDQLMFSVGGGGGYGSWPATDAVQIYDPMTDTWTLETPLPAAHGLNSAGWVGMGDVVSAGGYPTTYDAFRGANFPGGADPQAPAQPSGFEVSHNNTALMATLDWVNPSLNAGGGTLTDLDGVKIYRGGALIDDVTDVVIGAPYSYDDTVPAIGMYDYRIVPYNDWGDGIGALAGAWIGLDVPGAPTVSAGLADDEVLVTWTHPTEGAHQGYFPPNSWTGQKVYRSGIEIATLAGTNTSYNDTPPYEGTFTYSVAYGNSSGLGPEGFAAPLFVPGPPQYIIQEIPYEWLEISGVGTNTGITSDDQNAGPFDIGFVFPFYAGTSFDAIRVCSNGFASFTSTATSFTNYAIPTAAEPNNLLAVYWDDMNPSQGGAIYYYFDAPNSRFVVQWDGVPHYSTGGSYTFEVILYESGIIDYMYQELTAGTVNSATVGIENADGDEGLQATYNGSGPYNPTPSYGLRFAPPIANDMTVTLIPYGTPIQIPANGGTFEFNIELQNNETGPVNFDAWTTATLPGGGETGPLISATGLTLPGMTTVDRDRFQNVPANAPSGNYTYNAYVGIMPGMPWDSDSFTFEKLAVNDGGVVITDWFNWGEDFGDLLGELVVAAPDEFALHNAYPNPFNPTATIVYDLKEPANVKLVVYDVNGRQVSTLVNNWKQEGSHVAYFNGESMASGVYFYTITAGSFTETKKMILMK